jgi:hypothetical protein
LIVAPANAVPLQPVGRTQPVACLLVLAQLRLRDELRDRDLDPDDLRQQVVDERGVGIAHLPRSLLGHPRLVRACQARDEAAQEAHVVVDADRSVRMHDLVVPRRHLAMRLVLARVPIRRHVRVVRAEDHEHGIAVTHLRPDVVRAGDVSGEPAVRAFGGVELERQVVSIQAVGRVRDERAERMLAHDALDLFGSHLGEMGRDVHAASSRADRVARGSSSFA